MKGQTTKLLLALGGVVVVAWLISSYSSGKAVVGEGMEANLDRLAGSLGVQGPVSDSGPYGAPATSAGGNAQPTEQVQGRHPASQSTYSENTLSALSLIHI